ncbi:MULTISPECIES: class I SAM-dependent methyltransferase [Peptoniphilus]|jgi:rRNA methylase|uniref:tRNA (mnm(5)s(2)U34)-methyltransferase n=1 Tax=Peptoniphilus TaxID=162289 RepID=UPI000288027D|nr:MULTISPECIES: class I SAM-dependent methyltransferase [Peptoniphilus]MBS6610117.1 class I SAM-dependent methyltransferase [Peptoniphilus harei]MDU1043393.1 class I SAM-dependent methyltransferase [Peptoniphilus rhinitidis]MDU1954109.1 class I SAM-dependent methyltransferase [Peptoniphilus lacydonensis]MDU2109996.1 class I SAM-dependent methyltransferase [Peptoniphilus lacydonensis]MDU2115348.1 class I SAM-dependent methyltransferase [Peptoniphilus lacydonensis]
MIVKEKYFEIVDEVLSHNFLGKVAVDATIGKGNDTLKLLKVVGENGFVYGFDVQEDAIEKTRVLLKDFNNYKLFLESHEHIDKIGAADLIIYNLGFLPGSDKKITTLKESTIISLEKSTKILNKGGIIIVVSYLGHENSFEERVAVDEFLKELDQRIFRVEKREFYNQKHNPPIVYLIEKR